MIKKTITGLLLLFMVTANSHNTDAKFWTSKPTVVQQGGGTSTVQNDGDDVVFGSSSIELPYFRENWMSYGTSTFWIKTDLAPGTNTLYMYYNNPAATGENNYSAVFTKDFGETNIQALYHLDDGTGTIAIDVSSHARTATLVGNPTWATTDGGRWNGQNVSFATGSYLSMPGNQYMDLHAHYNRPSILTFSLWVRTTATTHGVILFQTQETNILTVASSRVPTILFQPDGTVRFELWQGNAGGIVSSFAINDGNWHYLVGVGNSNNQLFYVDGQLMGQRAGNISHWWWNNTAVGVGYAETARGAPADAYYYFNGDIDEVRVYNRALSIEEINAYYRWHKFVNSNLQVSYGAEENNPGTIYPGYSLRRPITIHNSGTTTLTNFQVKIPIRTQVIGYNIISD